MRSIAAVLLYPVALSCALLVAWCLLSLRASPEVASVAGAVIGGLFAFVGERLLPQTNEWRGTKEDIQLDLISLVVSSALLPLMQLLLDRALRAIYVPSSLWLDAPLWVQVVFALFLIELIQYTAHRAMHTSAYLWRFHAMHHSQERMQMWCAFRNHPVDTFLTVALPVAPLSWLGAPPEVVALCGAIVGANATLQHANIEMRDGVWSWVFSTGSLHRVHHHRDIISNSNYGGFLILWDLVLRTRRAPVEEVPLLGISGLEWFPKRYWGQLWSPFSARWRP